MRKKPYIPPRVLSRVNVQTTMGMACPGHLNWQQISCKC